MTLWLLPTINCSCPKWKSWWWVLPLGHQPTRWCVIKKNALKTKTSCLQSKIPWPLCPASNNFFMLLPLSFCHMCRCWQTKYIYIQSPMVYLPIFSFVPRVTQRQTLLQISNSNWTEWSKILRLLQTMSIFRLRTADFLSDSNQVRICREISLPHTRRFFGPQSISAMFEKTLVHVTLMTILYWLG